MSKKDDTTDMITQFSEDLSVILETFIEETQDAKIIISRMETEIGRLKEDKGKGRNQITIEPVLVPGNSVIRL